MSAIASNLGSFFPMHNMFAQACVTDVTPEIWAHRPDAGGNHPAWILTHLAGIRRAIARHLGAEIAPDDWEKQVEFGNECLPADKYPAMDAITEEFQKNGQYIAEQLASATDETMARVYTPGFPDGKERSFQEMLMFFISHESLHLGQMSYHRRLHDLGGIAQIVMQLLGGHEA